MGLVYSIINYKSRVSFTSRKALRFHIYIYFDVRVSIFVLNFHARPTFPGSSHSQQQPLLLLYVEFKVQILYNTLSDAEANICLQVPKDLKQRIEDYFQTSWSVSNGIDINEVSACHRIGLCPCHLMCGCERAFAHSMYGKFTHRALSGAFRRVLCMTRSARGLYS